MLPVWNNLIAKIKNVCDTVGAIKYGDISSSVKDLQTNLNKLGFNCLIETNTLAIIKVLTNKRAGKSHQAGQDFVLANGISDGTNPQNPVSREQLWAMLERMDRKLNNK